MVHPTALTGKTHHSLYNIMVAVKDLIWRKYNLDARPGKVSYRDPELPPFRHAFLGQPTVLPARLPVFAVEVTEVNYADAGQEAGSDNEAEINIILYGSKITREPQLAEAIKMSECVREIIRDNPTVPTAGGTERVFFLGYRDSRTTFERLVPNFEGEAIGIEVAILTMTAVWAETGF